MEDAWTRAEQIPEFRFSANIHLEIETVSTPPSNKIKSIQRDCSKNTQIGSDEVRVASEGREREVRLARGGGILW